MSDLREAARAALEAMDALISAVSSSEQRRYQIEVRIPGGHVLEPYADRLRAALDADPVEGWFDPSIKLPEDGQECLLMPRDHGGLVTIPVYGPIAWKATGAWFDVFRDPEGGVIVHPDDVGCWRLWDPIAPSDDLPRSLAVAPPPPKPKESEG
jgi:hypothetical protein